jgi:hypothetical protein
MVDDLVRSRLVRWRHRRSRRPSTWRMRPSHRGRGGAQAKPARHRVLPWGVGMTKRALQGWCEQMRAWETLGDPAYVEAS